MHDSYFGVESRRFLIKIISRTTTLTGVMRMEVKLHSFNLLEPEFYI